MTAPICRCGWQLVFSPRLNRFVCPLAWYEESVGADNDDAHE